MTTKSIEELIRTYQLNTAKKSSEKLIFSGVGDRDVYNLTAPFEDEGEYIIAARVERRDSEDSIVIFFVKRGDSWKPRENTKEYRLQDPFVTRVNGELIFGGVETYPHPTIMGALGYKTIFYRGLNINSLKKFAEGPEMMKDIRLKEFCNGNIAVFTRPQMEINSRGKIGYININSLEELNAETIRKAKILNDQFIEDEWGGVNEIHLLEDGIVGVLGHIACFDSEGNRHYYPISFKFNTITQESSEVRIIAKRDELLPGKAKRPDLIDVIFSGGIIRDGRGTAELYVGVSDAEAQKIIIKDPFFE